MSTTKTNGTKVVLPRLGLDDLWQSIHQQYAYRNQVKWKHLAMLTLHEVGNWPIEKISYAFGHNRGHITRCIEQQKKELREKFADPFNEQERRRPPNTKNAPASSSESTHKSAFETTDSTNNPLHPPCDQ